VGSKTVPFANRIDAGRQLAIELSRFANNPAVRVLGLPRGGVPVAYEVAVALKAHLSVFVVRKLGVPGQRELAMGAIASGGVRVLNEEVVSRLEITPDMIDRVAQQEERELERQEHAYRCTLSRRDVAGRIVILVDDGLATGATMRAGVAALRELSPSRIVIAVPVGAREKCELLEREADEVVCLHMPEPFEAVGNWYRNFEQTSDAEVRWLLETA